MGTPNLSPERWHLTMNDASTSSGEDYNAVGDGSAEHGQSYRLHPQTSSDSQTFYTNQITMSQTREQESRLDDDLAMLQAERVVSRSKDRPSSSLSKSRSRRTEHIDEFDVNTNPVHEKTAIYKPPEHPTSNIAKIFKRVHNSSFLVRYFMYIIPVAALLSVPLLIGALVYKNDDKGVGGVELLWFSVWLEIVWLTLWAGRIVAKMIPWPLGLMSSLFTNNSKKWRDMGKQLELAITLFFWWLGVEISFLPTMTNHRVPDYHGDTSWMTTVNQIIISIFVGAVLNLAEKFIIQLIATSFHLRTYADRIEINKFQIGSLVKLYDYSKKKIAMEDSDFEEHPEGSGPASGTRTPMQYVEKARRDFNSGFRKVGDVAGKVASDFTGKKVTKSTHPHQVVLVLLNSTQGSQVLARRLYRTFIREDVETVSSEDIKPAFENGDEAEAAFAMFDKDLNGDISMEELESVCVEIGRERKSITASLNDLDSVVSKLDGILVFVVVCVTILVFITLISTSAAGVLTSAGSTVLALSWLFSATAQEFLQSIIFVFVKHPFDVGDRVSVYGNTGASMKGDDYFVKEISLLYTEFKKMEGHIVQAPNSYLNTLFILNMRRSGGLAEAVPLTVKFGTTLEQFDELRIRLLDFVRAEKREYQGNILTEIRDVVDAYSVNLNVVFFYKSNWQNEGLRLQRRNKFICALMVSMQDIGIEGPFMRHPGQKSEMPFYVQYQSPRPTHLEFPDDPSKHPPSNGSTQEQPFVPNIDDQKTPRRQPSALRPSNTTRRARGRGESVSSMAKRVDFSLGMGDFASGDILGDVYDDGPRRRGVPEIMRTPASRGGDGDRIEEEDETAGRSSARENSENRYRSGLQRASTESQSRAKKHLGSIHRNRFFSRGSKDTEEDNGYESLMERGLAAIPESKIRSTRMDPRSGTISPQAVMSDPSKVKSGNGTASGPSETYSDNTKETFEMSRIH